MGICRCRAETRCLTSGFRPQKNLSVRRGFFIFSTSKKRNYFADFLVEEALLQEELLLLVFLAEAVAFLALPEVADLQEEDLQLLEI